MIGQTEWDVKHPNPTDLNEDIGGIRVGRIIKVYDADYAKSCASSDKNLYGKADVIWLDGVSRVPRAVDICRSWFSWKRGAGIFFMPEVDDIVVCQSRNNGYPVIVGFLPYKWDVSLNKLVKQGDSSVGRTKPLNKGEILIKSSSQAEIYINNTGSVNIRAKDFSDVENVTSNIEQNSTEDYFSRVRESNISNVAETVIGYSKTFDNNLKVCGSSPQVFESASVEYKEVSFTFPISKPDTTLEFFLADDIEVSNIVSVSVIGTNGKPTTLSSDQYSLYSSSYYLPFDADNLSLYFKPCSIEKNVIKYSLDINNFSLVRGQMVVLTVLTRKVKGAIRLNSEGDLFLDGRNVIIRSKNELATLSLDSLGKAKLRGVNTTLGNSCAGQVVVGENGVATHGLFSNDPEFDKKEASEGNIKYFYIEESLPLIKKYYTKEAPAGGNAGWQIDGVTLKEYQALSVGDKNSVNKITLSQIQDPSTINSEKLKKILKSGFPSYAELKIGE